MEYLKLIVLITLLMQNSNIKSIPAQQSDQGHIQKEKTIAISDDKWTSNYDYIAQEALRMIKILKEPDEYLSEADGEALGDIIRKLGQTGDMRAKPVLIEAMLCPKVGGLIIPKGLINLGSDVLPEIVALLDSTGFENKTEVITTLGSMAEIDSTNTYFTEKSRDEIITKFITLSENSDQKVMRAVAIALGKIGNSSTIPVLEKIKLYNATQKQTQEFDVKRAAERSIKRIQQREMKQNK